MVTAEMEQDELKSQFLEHPTSYPTPFTDKKAEDREAKGLVCCFQYDPVAGVGWTRVCLCEDSKRKAQWSLVC